LSVGTTPALDQAFVVSDLESTAADGVRVPLTLIEPKSAKRPQITLLDAYGSYGLSELPGFAPREIVLMQEGVNAATCHVRGGGELGEQWRLAGKDATANTWRDLIACAGSDRARHHDEENCSSQVAGRRHRDRIALTNVPIVRRCDGAVPAPTRRAQVFGERSADVPNSAPSPQRALRISTRWTLTST
jgi:hypothetical protein